MKNNKRDMIIVGGCVIAFILILIVIYNRKAIDISADKVAKIVIDLDSETKEMIISGKATIIDGEAINEATQKINGIKVKFGKQEYDTKIIKELDIFVGRVKIFYKDGTDENIEFYCKDMVYRDEVYSINLTEYKKLIELCRKYGTGGRLELNNSYNSMELEEDETVYLDEEKIVEEFHLLSYSERVKKYSFTRP